MWPEGVTVENGILTVPYNTTSLTYRYDVRGNGADDDYKEFVLTFDEVKEPDLPDDSSAPADTGSTAGGAIAAVAVGGAAVWGGYELVTRVMLIAGGLLFVNPTFATDIAALVLIAAEVVLDRAVLSKMKPVAA